jgi:glycosyltransferase involved in cell wall biosynthesis
VGASVLHVQSRRRPRDAVVVPGAVTPHRNAEGAIAAYAALPPDLRAKHRLVLGAGRRARQHLRLRRVARSAGVSAVTTAAAVPGCLRHASVALFPTFWDGYSPGAAEALALGVPIAASTTSAAAEVAVDPELLFDPRDPSSLARVLARALARAHVRPAPQRPPETGAALRGVWESVAAAREVLQPPNLLPSVSDAPA